jgi:hypothetical protein
MAIQHCPSQEKEWPNKVLDFRNLNKACPKDEFLLPSMDVLIDSVAGQEMFSFMDGFSGYNQIRMFQEIEDYVNDVVVKSKTREGHLETLRKVLERCRAYKLRMNPLKCVFGVSARKFLGFLVHKRGIDVDPAKATTIATMKPPTNVKQLKSFLGRLSYIRRFIPGLESLTSSFSHSLKKNVPFVWSQECQKAFETLKQIMSKLPIVCSSIIRKPLKLYLASNNQAIGALIAQDDEQRQEQPVYYVSRALKEMETCYLRAERVCLALKYAAQRLRHYFLAHQVHLMTKSHPIRTLLQRAVLSERLVR